MARQINAEGLQLIKTFEGLALQAYVDPVGVLTIGYGHVQGVTPGETITEQEAEQLLEQDLVTYENGVSSLVKVPLNDNEFSALVAFSYNVGLNALAGSTALKRLNAGDRLGAADALEWWNKGMVNGKLYVLPGLVRRRAAEKALFLKPVEGSVDQTKLGQTTSVSPNRKETPNGRDSLAQSRTIQGGAAAGAAATIGAVGVGSQLATQSNNGGTTTTSSPGTASGATTTTAGAASGTTATPPATPGASPATTTAPPIPVPTPPSPPPPVAPSSPTEAPISLPPGVSTPSSSGTVGAPSSAAPTPVPTPKPTPPSPPSPPAPVAAPSSGSATATPASPAAATATSSATPTPTTSFGTYATHTKDLVHQVADVFEQNPLIYAVLFAVIILGIIYVIYARVDDWKNGKR